MAHDFNEFKPVHAGHVQIEQHAAIRGRVYSRKEIGRRWIVGSFAERRASSNKTRLIARC